MEQLPVGTFFPGTSNMSNIILKFSQSGKCITLTPGAKDNATTSASMPTVKLGSCTETGNGGSSGLYTVWRHNRRAEKVVH